MSAQAGGPRCTETGRKRAFAGKDRFEKKDRFCGGRRISETALRTRQRHGELSRLDADFQKVSEIRVSGLLPIISSAVHLLLFSVCFHSINVFLHCTVALKYTMMLL